MSVTLIFKDKERRRHGTGVPSKLVRQKDGAPGYFVYSEGGLEQEEMDYIVEAQEEKRKNYKRITQPRKVGIEKDKDGYTLDVEEI
jgi:hypothetical protein